MRFIYASLDYKRNFEKFRLAFYVYRPIRISFWQMLKIKVIKINYLIED